MIFPPALAFFLAAARVVSSTSQTMEVIGKYRGVHVKTTTDYKCAPVIENDRLRIPKRNRYLGTIGSVFKNRYNLYELFLYENPQDGCSTIKLNSKDQVELEQLRRELIETKIDCQLNAPDYDSLIIDPDEILKSQVYNEGKVIVSSLPSLLEKANFVGDWEDRLEPITRGKFVVHFSKDSHGETLSYPDSLIGQEKSQNTLFQVFSQPFFEQVDYENLESRHFTTRIFIPAAAMTMRVFRGYEAADTRPSQLIGPDWVDKYIDVDYDNTIRIDNSKLISGILERIISDIENGEKIYAWSDVKISHMISPHDNRRLIDYAGDRQSHTFDMMFSSRLVFERNCWGIIGRFKKDIIQVVQLQYEAIILHAITKPKSPSSIHLYPILEMNVQEFVEMNLEALQNAITKWTKYRPALVVNFHFEHQVSTFPNTKVWKNFFTTIGHTFATSRVISGLAGDDGLVETVKERDPFVQG